MRNAMAKLADDQRKLDELIASLKEGAEREGSRDDKSRAINALMVVACSPKVVPNDMRVY